MPNHQPNGEEVSSSSVAPPHEMVVVNCFRCEDGSTQLYRSGIYAVRQCVECEQVFISPRPHEKDLESFYSDNYGGPEVSIKPPFTELKGRFFMKQQSIWAKGRLALIDQFSGLNPEPTRPYSPPKIIWDPTENRGKPQLLEIGVPTGWFFLRSAVDHGYRGYVHQYDEMTAEALKKAGGYLKKYGEPKTETEKKAESLLGMPPIYYGPIENAQIEETFDVVCAWDVIEHTINPGAFLEAIRNQLRNSGVVALSCPNFDSLPQKVLRSRWHNLKPGEHIWHFTPSTLSQALEAAGLVVKTVVVSPLHQANFGRLDSMVAVAQKA